MGRRGPSKTPTSQLASRGSWRAKTREGEPEPPAVGSVPAVPEALPGEAAVVWGEVAPQLVACGVLTAADLATFERYCRVYALWRRALAEIERAEGDVDRLAVVKIERFDAMLRRLERAFGLDPSARADLRIGKDQSESKHGNSGSPLKPRLVG